MKRTFFLDAHSLVGVMLLLLSAKVLAAPLTWFPGPALISPLSGAAGLKDGSYEDVVIGGDSYPYPEYLNATNSYWKPMTVPLSGIFIAPGAAAAGGSIILYGGTDGTASQSTAISYSPSDGATALASMSVPRSYLGYASDSSGNAYAIGGLDDTSNALASCEMYNQDANTWSAITWLPVARYNFPAVFDNTNRIYIFGGYTNTMAGTETASVLYYSTRSNTWVAVAPMPIATAGSAAAFGKDGKFYVAGGLSDGIPTNAVQVYDPAANAWTISTLLPEALSLATMGVDSLGRLVVSGGMDVNGNDTADVWYSQEFALPDSAPVFTQLPATNGFYGAQYSSAISATGNPQPTYTVLSGPTNLTVDLYSGAITWTPQGLDQIGSNSVTIQASNYAGTTNWSFAITVPNPPPSPVSNLTVVSVTDNSVTLSWDPEPDAAGACTFSAWLRHVAHSPKGSGVTVWYTQIGGTTTTDFLTVSGLTPGTVQAYYIVATGPGGSGGTNSAIAATTTAPQGPTNLWVTSVTSTSVGLAWSPSPGPAENPNFSPITSYTIMERNMSVYPPANVPTVTGITGTNGTIIGLVPGSSHLWFVSGVDVYGNVSALGAVYVVVANPPPARLSALATVAAGGGFQFSASEPGGLNQTVTIQATTNPADPTSWTTISSFVPTTSPFTFTDTNAVFYPNRFYRVLTQ